MTNEEQKLRQRIEEQDKIIEDLNRRCKVLLRMCDEWTRSYDRLLKDHIKIRNESFRSKNSGVD